MGVRKLGSFFGGVCPAQWGTTSSAFLAAVDSGTSAYRALEANSKNLQPPRSQSNLRTRKGFGFADSGIRGFADSGLRGSGVSGLGCKAWESTPFFKGVHSHSGADPQPQRLGIGSIYGFGFGADTLQEGFRVSGLAFRVQGSEN